MSLTLHVSDLHIGHKAICKYRPFYNSTHHDLYMITMLFLNADFRSILIPHGDSVFVNTYDDVLKNIWGIYQKVYDLGGNHCVAEDTEVLTNNGWKFAKDIDSENDLILCAQSFDGKSVTTNGVFSKVLNKNIYENRKLYAADGHWSQELVSDGHNVIFDGRRTSIESLPSIVPSGSFTYSLANTPFEYSETLINNLGIDMIKYLAWVICDGTLVSVSERKKRIQFKLSKDRKIKSLRILLDRLGIPYTFRVATKSSSNVLQPYYITIYGDWARTTFELLPCGKKFDRRFVGISSDILQDFIECLSETDGAKDHFAYSFATTCKESADNLQELFVRNGFRCKITSKDRTTGFANGKPLHTLLFKDDSIRRFKTDTSISSSGFGTVISLETTEGNFLSRRNGVVVLTGNCYENVKLKDKFFMTLDNVEVQAFFKKYNVWNSHAPVHPAELRDRLNLHGHVHDETVQDHRYVNCSMESEIMKYWPRNHQYLVANAATVEFRDHSLSRRDKWVNHLRDIFSQELPRQLYDYTRVLSTSEELTRAHLETLASFRRDTFVKTKSAVLADMKRFADAGLELFSKFKPEELADLLHNKHYGTMFYAEHYGDV